MPVGTPISQLPSPGLMADLANLGLDTGPLVATFRSTTNSYKHLLFRAILRSVAHEAGPVIPFERLFRLMLEEAWWPAFHYRLSLGPRDMVVARLDAIVADPDEWRLRPEQVRDLIAAVPFDLRLERKVGLLRFVPQRLISSWFEADLVSLPDAQRDRVIERLSGERFDDAQPLYRLREDGIELHPLWLDCLGTWLSIFHGWSDASWLKYLESRNPNATSLLVKIRPGFERSGLAEERRVWMEVARRSPLICIYSGQPVALDLFAIDHVLPYTFVGHDRFWNLTPTSPGVNSSKRDRLPSEAVIPLLARQHAQLWAVSEALPGLAREAVRRSMDEYVVDLGLRPDQLRDPDAMVAAYVECYGPLLRIARRMGFPDWQGATA
jgi:5-methylcytosine-specific restriction endonuclease McrA